MTSPGTFGSNHDILNHAPPPTAEQQRNAGLLMAAAALARDDLDALPEVLMMLNVVESPAPRRKRTDYGEASEAAGARAQRKGRA